MREIDTSKNGKRRKELKAVLRSISDSLGRYPCYRTVSKWQWASVTVLRG